MVPFGRADYIAEPDSGSQMPLGLGKGNDCYVWVACKSSLCVCLSQCAQGKEGSLGIRVLCLYFPSPSDILCALAPFGAFPAGS